MESKRILTEEDLSIAFDIRKEVFVKEQGVPLSEEFDEFDTLDAPCKHILVIIMSNLLEQDEFVR